MNMYDLNNICMYLFSVNYIATCTKQYKVCLIKKVRNIIFQIMWVGMTTNERINQAKYMYLEAMSISRGKEGHKEGQGHGHSHGGGPDCHADHSKNKYKNPFQYGF